MVCWETSGPDSHFDTHCNTSANWARPDKQPWNWHAGWVLNPIKFVILTSLSNRWALLWSNTQPTLSVLQCSITAPLSGCSTPCDDGARLSSQQSADAAPGVVRCVKQAKGVNNTPIFSFAQAILVPVMEPIGNHYKAARLWQLMDDV